LGVTVDGDDVEQAVREVAAAEVVSRFGRLRADQIHEKSPGDLVTDADRASEAALTSRLRAIADLPVVGEEATAADPSLLSLVAEAPAVWVVDPVDGTSNFVAGSPDHAVIVVLVEAGVTTRCWLYQPAHDTMLRAELGYGARRDGATVRADDPGGGPPAPGVLKTGYLPSEVRDRLVGLTEGGSGSVDLLTGAGSGRGCCPFDYEDAVNGAVGFLIYWRTLPWDHAGPALYASEAGLRVGRPGGSAYEPGDHGSGLIVSHAAVWDEVDAAFGRAL